MSPKEYHRRLQKVLVLSKLQDLAFQEIQENQVDLRDEKENEFERGERPSGRIIGEYRSRSYARFKQRKNPLAGGKVDLILSRSFITSARLTRKGNRYSWLFTDKKAKDLLSKYGQDLKGMNQGTFNEHLKKRTAKQFYKAIKLYARIR